MTVLFCDLVGSTPLAQQLDAEDWREVLAQYHAAAAGAVARWGGHVAKNLGDGLLVYFGWPSAREDDPERAVRAGLAMLEAMAPLNATPGAGDGTRLEVRIGMDTGPVVVADGGEVFGETANVAARAQSAAEPDTVVITAATQRLVTGIFAVEDRGPQALKGLREPVTLYRVVRPSGVRSRLAAAAGRLTPFVGREVELATLVERCEQARDGAGQNVVVLGEAGVGKSRLLYQLRERLAAVPYTWLECGATAYTAGTPFHPVIALVAQGLAFAPEDTPADKLAKIERGLGGLATAETVALLADLVGLPPLTRLQLSPELQRRRTIELLAQWTLAISALQPLVLLVEDLHWCDPSSLELLGHLVTQSLTARVLLLVTARPEFTPPWPARENVTTVTLARFTKRQTREMVIALAGERLPLDTLDALVARADGVPLYVEELTKSVLEPGTRRSVEAIPATLAASLMARLDRLGPAKEVAQVAAVIGREFSYELLQVVSAMPDDELQSALAKLANAELIYARAIPPETRYQFKHALIQDAAYEALLKSRRRELHRRVARAIANRFPAVAEAQPEVLARHWTEAGEAESAIAAWRKAGEAADARRALKEAEEGYRRALAILNTLPESLERDARELELTSALVQVLQLAKGYSAPESVEAAARARALAERSGNLAQLVRQAFATWTSTLASGDYPSASVLADQLLDLARHEGSPPSLGLAHTAQVMVRFYRGDLVGVEEHFARLNPFLQAPGFRQFPGAFVVAMILASLGAWSLGHADSARERIAQMIAFAGDSENPYDLALGRFFESWLCRWLGEPQRVEAAARQALALAEEHGFPFVRDWARTVLGSARAQLGGAGEGVSLIRQGLAGLVDTGARLRITEILTWLAEAQALDGAIDDALSTIEDALKANPEEVFYRPNTLTCRGELRLKAGHTELAEADFRRAIALAQDMSAKALELRAAISLARMLRARGERADARELLGPVYDWFTEGFDTRGLKDAKALLDELR